MTNRYKAITKAKDAEAYFSGGGEFEDINIVGLRPHEDSPQVVAADLVLRGWMIAPYPDDQLPDLAQDTLALQLSDAGWSRDARFVAEWGKWFLWDDTRWCLDTKLEHMTQIRHYLRAKHKSVIAWAENQTNDKRDELLAWAEGKRVSLCSKNNVAAIESLVRSNSDIAAVSAQFDADRMLLGTPGGTVDLTTGVLRAARHTDYITRLCAATPSPPGTDARLWNEFLEQTFAGDREVIQFMQRAAGYALTGQTNEHKLFFLWGKGGNGKSVFTNTLQKLMNEYSARATATTFLETRSEQHPTNVAKLQGARLVVASELAEGQTWNEAVIKDLTGGDVMTARFMRQDFFEFEPQFSLFIFGNHKPSFRGVDDAIRRRVVLVPFTHTVPPEERDRDLELHLQREWSAILRWMIDGAVEWQQRGLCVPESIQAASDDYLDHEDVIGDFFATELESLPGAFTSNQAMYARFRQWQESMGIQRPWTQKAMTQALTDRGVVHKRTKSERGWKDYQLVLKGVTHEY